MTMAHNDKVFDGQTDDAQDIHDSQQYNEDRRFLFFIFDLC